MPPTGFHYSMQGPCKGDWWGGVYVQNLLQAPDPFSLSPGQRFHPGSPQSKDSFPKLRGSKAQEWMPPLFPCLSHPPPSLETGFSPDYLTPTMPPLGSPIIDPNPDSLPLKPGRAGGHAKAMRKLVLSRPLGTSHW